MEKKLLITVSDDVSCLHGVRFVGSFFHNKDQIRVVLFYESAMYDPKFRREDYESQAQARKAGEKQRARGEGALEASKKLLCTRGIDEEHVDCKFTFKQFGTVKDIVKEGTQGRYDAVVLGRRGYHLFASLLGDSVSREILDQEIDFPIWISRHCEEGRRNVLLCVDGSEQSLRMADHAGFMLENEDRHSVTLFHVDTGHGMNVDAVMDEARRKLVENGVGEERIKNEVVRSNRVVRSVHETIHREAYAAVGVGRVGLEKGRLKGWLMGSTPLKLLEDLEKATLWVSR